MCPFMLFPPIPVHCIDEMTKFPMSLVNSQQSQTKLKIISMSCKHICLPKRQLQHEKYWGFVVNKTEEKKKRAVEIK